jgi:hypothetical protein
MNSARFSSSVVADDNDTSRHGIVVKDCSRGLSNRIKFIQKPICQTKGAHHNIVSSIRLIIWNGGSTSYKKTSCFLFFFFSAQTVLQGTQLLAIDTGAAMGLLKRALIGDELTQKEKQALQRTLTDLASVVPIGILMLLPVSLSCTCISTS